MTKSQEHIRQKDVKIRLKTIRSKNNVWEIQQTIIEHFDEAKDVQLNMSE